MDRRRYLSLVGSLGILLTGCLGQGNTPTQPTDTRGSTSSDPTDTPTPTQSLLPNERISSPQGKCEAFDLPLPTPTAEGLTPMQYPDLPSTRSVARVKSFATEFEQAYQYNKFLDEAFISGTDEIDIPAGVPDWAVKNNETKLVVGVSGELKTADVHTSTGTQAPYLDWPFAAWYKITDQAVYRKEIPEVGIQKSQFPQDWNDAAKIFCL